VEVERLGGAYLDTAGLSLLYGDDETLASKIVFAIQKRLALPAQVGVSISKLAAILSARSVGKDGIKVVTIGELRHFLEELPVGSLSLPAEALERLRRLGIHTVGQFLRLPVSEIKDQLGEEASLAYRALLGLPGEKVEPRPSRSRLRQYQEMERPLFSLGELSPVLARLVSQLADALAARYQYSQALTLRLELETGKSWEASMLLKEPTGERRALMEAAQRLALQVSSVEAALGIAGVEVTLEGLGREVGRQLKLFDTWADRQRRRAQLSSALALIQRRFGDRLRDLTPEPALSLPLSR
jgi:protein ImuB